MVKGLIGTIRVIENKLIFKAKDSVYQNSNKLFIEVVFEDDYYFKNCILTWIFNNNYDKNKTFSLRFDAEKKILELPLLENQNDVNIQLYATDINSGLQIPTNIVGFKINKSLSFNYENKPDVPALTETAKEIIEIIFNERYKPVLERYLKDFDYNYNQKIEDFNELADDLNVKIESAIEQVDKVREYAEIAQQSATNASNSASSALNSSNKAKEHLDNVVEKTNTFNQGYVSKVEEFNANVENANKVLDKKIEDVNFEIDKKLDKNLGEENAGKLLGTDADGNIIVKDEIKQTAENVSYNEDSNVKVALDDVYEKLGNLMYTPLSITSFTNNKATVEMGNVITDVVLNWNYNKVPKTLTLDNETLDVNLKTKTLSGQNIRSNKTYTLKATDERNTVATKTTSITFLNGVYYGVGDSLEIDGITNEFILSLTKTLQSSKAKTFTVNAGKGKHIYYVIPSRYGTPIFKVGGFEGGFGKLGTFSFTNASGYTEDYDIYKSSNSNLGNTTVVVS